MTTERKCLNLAELWELLERGDTYRYEAVQPQTESPVIYPADICRVAWGLTFCVVQFSPITVDEDFGRHPKEFIKTTKAEGPVGYRLFRPPHCSND